MYEVSEKYPPPENGGGYFVGGGLFVVTKILTEYGNSGGKHRRKERHEIHRGAKKVSAVGKADRRA